MATHLFRSYSLEPVIEAHWLVEVVDDFNDLLNVRVSSKLLVSDEDLGRRLHEVSSELLDFFRPGCRKHKRLAILTDLTNNFPDLWFET